MDKVFGALAKNVMLIIMEDLEIDKMDVYSKFKMPINPGHSKLLCAFLGYLILNHHNTFSNSTLFEEVVSATKGGKKAYVMPISQADTNELIALAVFRKFIDKLHKQDD